MFYSSILGKGAGHASRKEEEAEISAGLWLTWILLCSLLLAGWELEHPFLGSRGKSLFLALLRQVGQFLG